jgi:phosphatidate cytidylyltransferase
MSQDTVAPTPSKQRVFASRLISTLVLWGIITAAVQWKTDWVLIALTGFFGVA